MERCAADGLKACCLIGPQSGLRCQRGTVRRSEGTSPLFGMALPRRLHRVVSFSWSSPGPECGTVAGINSRRM